MRPASRTLLQRTGLPFPFDNPLLVPTAAMAYRFDILVSHLHQLAVFTRLVLFVTVPNVSLLPGTHTTHPLDNTQCRQA